jgi:hypothetical protein
VIHFERDWSGFLARLDVWEALAPSSRRAMLAIKSGQNASPGSFGPDLPELLGREFLVRHPGGGHVTLHDDARPFSRAVRAMARHPIHPTPGPQACREYLRDHFDAEHLAQLCSVNLGERGGADPAEQLARVIPAQWRIDQFLSFMSAQGFSQVYPMESEKYLTPDIQTLRDAQQIAAVLSTAGHQRFSALSRTTAIDRVGRLSAAVGTLVCWALAFPGLDDAGLPVIGLWPLRVRGGAPSSAAGRAAAPTPREPPSSRVTREGHHADEPLGGVSTEVPEQQDGRCYAAEDAAAVLRLTAAGPVSLKLDSWAVHAKHVPNLRSLMIPTPEWRAVDPTKLLVVRARRAMQTCINLKVGRVTADEGARFEALPGAAEFLAKPPADRIAAVLGVYRHRRRLAHTRRGDRRSGSKGLSPFLPGYVVRAKFHDDDELIQSAFVAAMRDLPVTGWVDVAVWALERAQTDNPFARFSEYPRMLESPDAVARIRKGEALELWEEQVKDVVMDWLSWLGAVRLGVRTCKHGCKHYLAGRTPVMAYLLHETEQVGPAPTQTPANVHVQPNFEVLFLSPGDAAESALSPFCERIGASVGAVFRITRQSVLAAAASGMTATQMHDALRSVCGREPPPNVEREIAGWVSACKRIGARRSLVLRCPDPETAVAVRRAAGNDAEVIGERIVEIKSGKVGGDLRRKLVGMGLFVSEEA